MYAIVFIMQTTLARRKKKKPIRNCWFSEFVMALMIHGLAFTFFEAICNAWMAMPSKLLL